ncbi:UDP-glycosyltransferase UGT5-like [Hetaerina americana]|uniref:UDP-glycosyltransferase UGT5-like n=1 Tax=Hetaerina americana TaxID=62018 RepID=UPI003A7F3991
MGCNTCVVMLVTSFMLLQCQNLEGANILVLFGQGSRSHNNIYVSVTTALANRGHNLTVITPLPIASPPPNYKQIDTSSTSLSHFSNFTASKRVSIFGLFRNFSGLAFDNCNVTLSDPRVKLLMDPTVEGNKFDLLITSTVLAECFYGFAHVYKVPIVLISPNGPILTTISATGNTALPSFVPHMLLSYTDHMTFYERLLNSVFYWGSSYMYSLTSIRQMNAVMKLSFGESIPSIADLEKYVSLVLVNTHFSFNYPQPLSPTIVEVGGIHIKPPKDLPKELKTFLDDASKNGAIYFSLGSILKSSGLEDETRDAFINAFSKLKQKVLWKWEGANPLPGQTKNIRLEKWLPQQDVLAHPNVKLFITHGGLLSLQEATARGVPVVGIPFYGDQDSNMVRINDLNAGVTLDANNLTSDNILNAIQTVLDDPKYAESMKNLQSIVTDRPQEPIDTAMYWIEYVLRHNGAKHMKPYSSELHYLQIFLVDVVLIVFVLPALILLATIYFIIKKCLSNKSIKHRKTNALSKKRQ